jgi:hypothetical protein
VSLLEAAGFDVKKEFVLNGQHYYYAGYNSPGQPIKEKSQGRPDYVGCE